MVESIRMDERLTLLKKNKPVQCRCILTQLNEFIVYEANGRTIKTVLKLKDCEKISRYQDNSWEITHKVGKSFRFLGDKTNSNRWFNTIYSLFTTDVQAKESNQNSVNSHSEPMSLEVNTEVVVENAGENIYELVIDVELTDPDLLKKLSIHDTYYMNIDENGISLESEHKKHVFEPSSIKKYGSTNDCFAFELGRKSNFGSGIIALQSKKYNSKIIYDHFNELTEQSFHNLRDKFLADEATDLNNNETVPKVSTQQRPKVPLVKQESDASDINWFTPSASIGSNQIEKCQDLERKSETTSNIGSISESIDSYSTVEIPIIVEDRSKRLNVDSSDLLNNSNVSSSTFNADETLTFYEDKYVPEYMSTKSTAENLVSKPLEYFEDSDQMVYARVKL